MIPPSTLIARRPNGAEDRQCNCIVKGPDGKEKACGQHFLLPKPYEQCNPITRDMCTECISNYQRAHEEEGS